MPLPEVRSSTPEGKEENRKAHRQNVRMQLAYGMTQAHRVRKDLISAILISYISLSGLPSATGSSSGMLALITVKPSY